MRKITIIQSIVCLLFLFASLNSVAQTGFSDTSKVCTGQTTILTGPEAPVGITYSYEWFDDGATPAFTTQVCTLSSAVLVNVTQEPKQFVYKLVVSQTGATVGSCPSDTFYKVILVYPALSSSVASNFSTLCSGSQTDLVLTATATSGSPAGAPSMLNGVYGDLQYTFSGGGINTPVTNTGIANNTYTLLSSNLPAANATPYTYMVDIAYVESLQGSTAVLANCKSSANTSVTITTAPAISNTSVTTSFAP